MPKRKVIRIATGCKTPEQFYATFWRFCEDDACFVPTSAMRPVGLETLFALQLANGDPLVRGVGMVMAAWPTKDNPFGRPGLFLGFRRLTPDSHKTLKQLARMRGTTRYERADTTRSEDDVPDVRIQSSPSINAAAALASSRGAADAADAADDAAVDAATDAAIDAATDAAQAIESTAVDIPAVAPAPPVRPTLTPPPRLRTEPELESADSVRPTVAMEPLKVPAFVEITRAAAARLPTPPPVAADGDEPTGPAPADVTDQVAALPMLEDFEVAEVPRSAIATMLGVAPLAKPTSLLAWAPQGAPSAAPSPTRPPPMSSPPAQSGSAPPPTAIPRTTTPAIAIPRTKTPLPGIPLFIASGEAPPPTPPTSSATPPPMRTAPPLPIPSARSAASPTVPPAFGPVAPAAPPIAPDALAKPHIDWPSPPPPAPLPAFVPPLPYALGTPTAAGESRPSSPFETEVDTAFTRRAPASLRWLAITLAAVAVIVVVIALVVLAR